MQFTQTHTIKAIGDEIHRQAFNARLSPEEAGQRAGPIDRVREATGLALTTLGERVACEGGSAQVAPSDKRAA